MPDGSPDPTGLWGGSAPGPLLSVGAATPGPGRDALVPPVGSSAARSLARVSGRTPKSTWLAAEGAPASGLERPSLGLELLQRRSLHLGENSFESRAVTLQAPRPVGLEPAKRLRGFLPIDAPGAQARLDLRPLGLFGRTGEHLFGAQPIEPSDLLFGQLEPVPHPQNLFRAPRATAPTGRFRNPEPATGIGHASLLCEKVSARGRQGQGEEHCPASNGLHLHLRHS